MDSTPPVYIQSGETGWLHLMRHNNQGMTANSEEIN